MNAQSEFKIDFLKDYKENFKWHLELDNNERIIFSGIFGIGKTTFVKEFFNEEDVKEKYEAIHLFPVNYSVASNEDIFELIKFDILLQLLGKNIDFEKLNFSFDISFYEFIKENYTDILLPFLKFIPLVGGELYDTSKKLLELKEKFDKFRNDINITEKDKIINFLNEFNKKEGTIYENDFYTELIIALIDKLKIKKKVILIIDDLDRIDPEHIFRILNVFSAHVDVFGNEGYDNKFGINQVMLICDINNIRNIYKHKYGIETDFNGYINKFFSREIFEFNLKKVFDSIFSEFYRRLNILHNDFAIKTESRQYLFKENINFILKIFFENGLLNLREIKRCLDKKDIILAEYNTRKIGNEKAKEVRNKDLYALLLFDIMLIIFGDSSTLFNKISFCTGKLFPYENKNIFFVAELFLVLDIENHKFEDTREDSPYQFGKFNYGVTYKMDIYQNRDGRNEIAHFYSAIPSRTHYKGVELEKIDYFDLLNKTFKLALECRD